MERAIRCQRCKQERPWALFSTNTIARYRVGATNNILCDPCRQVLGDATSRANGHDPDEQRLLASRGEKRCTHCGQAKPLDAFNKDRNAPDGLRHRCRDCQNQAAKRHHAAKRTARLAMCNPHDRIFTPEERRVLAARGEKRCAYCAQIKSIDHFGAYHASFDGLNARCRTCVNSTKRSHAALRRALTAPKPITTEVRKEKTL